jgi:hypothetical protein
MKFVLFAAFLLLLWLAWRKWQQAGRARFIEDFPLVERLDHRLAAAAPRTGCGSARPGICRLARLFPDLQRGRPAHGGDAVAGGGRCLARIHSVYPAIRQLLPPGFRPLPAPYAGRSHGLAAGCQRQHQTQLATGLRPRRHRPETAGAAASTVCHRRCFRHRRWFRLSARLP